MTAPQNASKPCRQLLRNTPPRYSRPDQMLAQNIASPRPDSTAVTGCSAVCSAGPKTIGCRTPSFGAKADRVQKVIKKGTTRTGNGKKATASRVSTMVQTTATTSTTHIVTSVQAV